MAEGLVQIYNLDEIFQYDRASCHTSKSTKKYLQDNHINSVENWPPQSPDLNIIEPMWAILKKSVMERKPKNVDELWQFSQEEWEKIPLDTLQKAYKPIPRRIRAVLEAKGSHTKY